MTDLQLPEDERVRCPIPACPRRMPSRFCLCTRHWEMVPSMTRRRVVEAQRRGLGPFVRCTDCTFQSNTPEDCLSHIRETRGHLVKVIGPPSSWPTAEYREAAALAVSEVMGVIGLAVQAQPVLRGPSVTSIVIDEAEACAASCRNPRHPHAWVATP